MSETYDCAKNRGAAATVNTPVSALIGLSLVFCILPPQQKTVFPVKYSQFFPRRFRVLILGASWGLIFGVDSVEPNFSCPCCRGVTEVLELPLRLFLAGRMKLDRNDLGDFGGG